MTRDGGCDANVNAMDYEKSVRVSLALVTRHNYRPEQRFRLKQSISRWWSSVIAGLCLQSHKCEAWKRRRPVRRSSRQLYGHDAALVVVQLGEHGKHGKQSGIDKCVLVQYKGYRERIS